MMCCLRCYQLEEENTILKQQIESSKPQTFNEYDIVNQQIKYNRLPRINWVLIFGETLTKKVATYYAKGFTPEQAYNDIVSKLKNMAIDNEELFRKLKIGVCARYGEIRSESKRISEVRT